MLKQNWRSGLLCIVLGLLLQGCSVVLASMGDEEPNMGVIQPGATRAMVEAELGKPYHTEQQGDQHTDWYEYEMGNAPNTDRALGHFGLDVYSFLLWEVIATPMELLKGDDYKMSVTYGPDDQVIAVHPSEKHPLPEKETETEHAEDQRASNPGAE